MNLVQKADDETVRRAVVRVLTDSFKELDTIEEKVAALAQRKAALFSGVMDEGDLFASGLTAEDIRGLLD